MSGNIASLLRSLDSIELSPKGSGIRLIPIDIGCAEVGHVGSRFGDTPSIDSEQELDHGPPSRATVLRGLISTRRVAKQSRVTPHRERRQGELNE